MSPRDDEDEARDDRAEELADVDADLGSVAELRDRARRLRPPLAETPRRRRLTLVA